MTKVVPVASGNGGAVVAAGCCDCANGTRVAASSVSANVAMNPGRPCLMEGDDIELSGRDGRGAIESTSKPMPAENFGG
jgi:hypothetical protein